MILPSQTLGMLGGGQLGRMFTLRARAMGYRVVVLDPDPDSPAGHAANVHIHAKYDDPAALDRLAGECAAVSTEFENVPAVVLERLATRVPVHPSAAAVAVCQDRITEKSFLRDHGFATAAFRPVASAAEAARALGEVGAPALLKTSRLGYVGVLGVEMFVSGGKLLINELAPRPHNSGHWTQDAAVTDQFEQQVRAMCGLPLGSPTLLTPVAMVNVLGDLWSRGEPDWAGAMALPGVVVHLYGKKEPRVGRKMGHLNCYGATADEALRKAEEAWGRLGG